jgi:hypothetical protein
MRKLSRGSDSTVSFFFLKPSASEKKKLRDKMTRIWCSSGKALSSVLGSGLTPVGHSVEVFSCPNQKTNKQTEHDTKVNITCTKDKH